MVAPASSILKRILSAKGSPTVASGRGRAVSYRVPNPPRRPTPLRLATAIILLVQAAPTLGTLVGSVGHGLFHGFESAVRAQLQSEVRIMLPDATENGFTHRHGPEAEAHAHTPLIDLALTVTANEDHDPQTPAPPVDLRVDRHIPPTILALAEVPPTDERARFESDALTSAAPSPPPLRPPRG